jgi:SAM-dependent methyltransferase
MADRPFSEAVSRHYTATDLVERLRAALHAAGKDVVAAPDDLAPVDQIHTGGTRATIELADLAGLRAGQSVLDVGGGIGGPARTLAHRFGCTVTVLDLTEEYCHAGELLTAVTALTDRVSFRHGDAMAMPFPDGSFDVVWTQHSSMNIADKAQLYAEIRRVLRPGGRFALHEVLAGPTQPVHFPVPWARDPAISFLETPENARRTIQAAGFAEVAWINVTASSLAWFQRQNARAQPATPPPLSLHLLLGPDVREMGRNMERNLEGGRIAVIQGVLDRR